MKTTNDIFKGSDASLTEVNILPVGSYGAGSYSLPAGDMWTDYESVEITSVSYTEPNAVQSSTSLVTKEQIADDPDGWLVYVLMSDSTTNRQLNVQATGISSFSVVQDSGTPVVKQIKAYKKKYTTRNLSKVVSVNGGSNIAIDSRYEIDIATMLGSEYLNRDLVVVAEIYNTSGNEGWGDPKWATPTSTSDTYGTRASILGDKIIVQTGRAGISSSGGVTGGPFGPSGNVTSAPCRIKVWKVDEYLPATRSSGDITTIWTGSAGDGVTVDWSGTGYTLSQFDAILLQCDFTSTTGISNMSGLQTMQFTTSDLLTASPSRKRVGMAVIRGTASEYIVIAVRDVSETNLLVTMANSVWTGVFTGIYGINYK